MQDITTGLACAKILILVIGKHVIIVVMIFTTDNRIGIYYGAPTCLCSYIASMYSLVPRPITISACSTVNLGMGLGMRLAT